MPRCNGAGSVPNLALATVANGERSRRDTRRGRRDKRGASVSWNPDAPPASMQRLPPLARAKAIEIAHALLDEGMDEGKAIRIAIAKAKEWAEARPKNP
jgi:hypothetical protein